jgi:VWFA-related protein
MKPILLAAFFLIFCGSIFSIHAQEVGNDEVIKVKTTLVSVPVLVSDRSGRYIPGMAQNEFELYQDGIKQTISFFGTEEEPLNVAILLDTSKSTKDVLGKIKDAAKNFIKLLQPNDRAMIVTFDFKVNVLAPLSSDRKVLEKAIKNAKVGERVGTVMRDAVEEVVNRMFANVRGRKAIILLTDGKDFGSYSMQEELLDDVEESDVMIYSVFYKTGRSFNQRRFDIFNGGIFGRRRGRMGGNFPPRMPNLRRLDLEKNAIEYLQEMSELTAGRFYEKDVTDLDDAFKLIADELRKQYRLGFYPKDSDDSNTVHQLKVKVTRPNVAVRSRSTYRAK